MRIINTVVWHCSASDDPKDDSIEAVRDLHTSPITKKIKWGEYNTHGKGWSDVGYQWFINSSGLWQIGRPIYKRGAHVRGHNSFSVGICLSGNEVFSEVQIDSALVLTDFLMQCFDLKNLQVVGHYELDVRKTCPNLDMARIRLNLLDVKHSRNDSSFTVKS